MEEDPEKILYWTSLSLTTIQICIKESTTRLSTKSLEINENYGYITTVLIPFVPYLCKTIKFKKDGQLKFVPPFQSSETVTLDSTECVFSLDQTKKDTILSILKISDILIERNKNVMIPLKFILNERAYIVWFKRFHTLRYYFRGDSDSQLLLHRDVANNNIHSFATDSDKDAHWKDLMPIITHLHVPRVLKDNYLHDVSKINHYKKNKDGWIYFSSNERGFFYIAFNVLNLVEHQRFFDLFLKTHPHIQRVEWVEKKE